MARTRKNRAARGIAGQRGGTSARKAGVPIVGVYETTPAGYNYQGWMLAEVHAITKAVTSKTSPGPWMILLARSRRVSLDRHRST